MTQKQYPIEIIAAMFSIVRFEQCLLYIEGNKKYFSLFEVEKHYMKQGVFLNVDILERNMDTFRDMLDDGFIVNWPTIKVYVNKNELENAISNNAFNVNLIPVEVYEDGTFSVYNDAE